MGDHEQGKDSLAEWETVSSTRLAEYEMFSVRKDRVRMGSEGEEKDFEVVESPGGVVVIALTAAGEMVMVEQYRVPLERVTLELPAGIVEEDEDPAEGARRELREETGYQGGRAEHLGTMALNPSWQTSRVHVVALRGVERTGEKELDEAEDTRVRLLTPQQVDERVADGRVDAAVTLAALAMLDRAGRS